jgi:hypothetical protein
VDSEWAFLKLADLDAAAEELSALRKAGSLPPGARRQAEKRFDLLLVPVNAIGDTLFTNWQGPHGRSLADVDWVVQKIKGELIYADELDAHLAPGAPDLRADRMHPWIWKAARSLWESGHYADAVETAAKKVNAELQNKLNRRDASDAGLCGEAFSLKAPTSSAARLRFPGEDRSDETWIARQEGALALSRGAYMAIRNPLAHNGDQDMPEHQAMEMLSVFSIIARWIVECSVETAASTPAPPEAALLT